MHTHEDGKARNMTPPSATFATVLRRERDGILCVIPRKNTIVRASIELSELSKRIAERITLNTRWISDK